MKQVKKTSKFYNSTINKRIREFLDSKKMSINDFAEALDVKAESVRQWKGGYSRPDIDKIFGIAKIMECSIEYLLDPNGCKNIKNTSANEDFNLWEEASESLRKMKDKDFGTDTLLGPMKPRKFDIKCTNIISYFISQSEFWEKLQQQMNSINQYYTDPTCRKQFDKLLEDNAISRFNFANHIINPDFDNIFKDFVKANLKYNYPHINIDDI